MQADSLGETNIFGDRVELRPVSQSDFELLYLWLNNPEIYRWWGGVPIDSEVVQQKYLGLRRPQIDGYVIEVTGVPIGYAQRHQTGDHEGSVDLFLVPEMRGLGYGGDAVNALARHFAREFHIEPPISLLRRRWKCRDFDRRPPHGAFFMSRSGPF